MNQLVRHIEGLLDRIETLLDEGVKVPLTGRVMVESEELLSLLELIRQALPEEMREAVRIVQQREQILAEAREEASGLLERAQEAVSKLTDETAIAQEAQQRAEALVEKSRDVAQEIRMRAIEYADEVLERLETQLQRTLETLHKHREELRR